ncbi:NADPH:adrenodoxin oxidoreductase, mitochondrial-like [Homarus americanus]|uniref:NADPH:adrenodoxin oxidoreductase, mitochondrial-like n=1 Tax=Homarus americanus TaxID=6706 RepID=UPI001C46591F|nr:NADPH:adrenodoxin oxidoreductase, mitochondrial-like [Homarus americanus]
MMLSCGVSRLIVRHLRTGVASTAQVPQVCIVGSGPAGFYTAQQILKSHAAAQVDMYEKLPVPFGLVRYGVAPDHPEVKNCINTFTQTAAKDRFTFLGNVDIGSDITFSQLREAYHAVVLAYGAAQDRALNIPGESLPNVLSAREFVGWYNGLPENADLKVDLNVESVGIIGQGNVAVDVARILLTPVDILKKTDIPENILERLNGSRVRHMTLVGRRGPEHVAFTIKELREMVNLEGSRPDLRREDYKHLRNLIPNLPRPRKRLLELLAKTGLDAPDPKLASSWAAAEKQWSLRFLRSPVEILATPDGQTVGGVILAKNRLEGEGLNQRAVQTDETESLQCGLILRSIGYKGVEIDSSLPFDQRTGTISNNGGRVTGQNGVYVSGWIGTGPVGVILSTMTSGFTTGKVVVADMETGSVDISRPRSGQTLIKSALAEKGVQPVSFDQWNRLNQYEVETGAKLGKPREKVSNIKHMMDIIHQ